MKKRIRITIYAILAVSMATHAQNRENNSSTKSDLRGDRVEYSEVLQSFGESGLNDANSLLGLAFLYEVNGPPAKAIPEYGAYRGIEDGLLDPARRVDLIADLYRKAIAASPTSRPARAGLARRCTQTYASKHRRCSEELDALVAYAKERNLNTVDVPRISELYVLLGKYGSYDLGATVKEVNDLLREDAHRLTASLSDSEASDPNNALYNYLKAQVLFVSSDSSSAIVELKKAASKPYLDNFRGEAGEARSEVLDRIGIPEDHGALLKQKYSLYIDSLMVDSLWPRLESAEEASARKGDSVTALMMNDVTTTMVRHLKTEPRPLGSGITRERAQYLEDRVANRRRLLEEPGNRKER